jgi:uncharacterized protein
MRFWRRRPDEVRAARSDQPRDAPPPADAPFPEFPYHPDPRATGSVVVSDARCLACGHVRGYIYTGPASSEEELAGALCPWCIADGSAAAKFDAHFTDVGWGVPEGVPPVVVDEIAGRTPGFTGWQQEHWLYHCGDGAAFLGLAGRADLEPYPDALEELRGEQAGWGWPEAEIEEYVAALDKEGQPTAYLFRCRHCGRHLAYSDFT